MGQLSCFRCVCRVAVVGSSWGRTWGQNINSSRVERGVGLGKGGDELGVEIVSSAGSGMDRSCDRGSVMAGSGRNRERVGRVTGAGLLGVRTGSGGRSRHGSGVFCWPRKEVDGDLHRGILGPPSFRAL
jgi:hypothetical protein